MKKYIFGMLLAAIISLSFRPTATLAADTTTATELIINVGAKLSDGSSCPKDGTSVEYILQLYPDKKIIDGVESKEGIPMPTSTTLKLTGTGKNEVDGNWNIPVSGVACGTYYYTITQTTPVSDGYDIDNAIWYVTAKITATEAKVISMKGAADLTEIKDETNFTIKKAEKTTATVTSTGGITELTLGGNIIPSEYEDLKNTAVIKSNFTIDFTKDFVVTGKVTTGWAADGSFIGFVPGSSMPDELLDGGNIAVYNTEEFINSVLFEFDTWGNSDTFADDGDFSSESYGTHFALMEIDEKGMGHIVNNQSTTDCAWNEELSYTITLDTKRTDDSKDDVLTFNVGDKYVYSYTNPIAHFNQNTAYFFLGGSIRGSLLSWYYFPGGQEKGDPSPKTSITFESFQYTQELEGVDVKALFTNTYIAQSTSYDISFDANGGDGTMTTVSVAESTYTLPECNFIAPESKVFAGWSYSADGELIRDTIISVTADITLYAIWIDIPENFWTYNAETDTFTINCTIPEMQEVGTLIPEEVELTGSANGIMYLGAVWGKTYDDIGFTYGAKKWHNPINVEYHMNYYGKENPEWPSFEMGEEYGYVIAIDYDANIIPNLANTTIILNGKVYNNVGVSMPAEPNESGKTARAEIFIVCDFGILTDDGNFSGGDFDDTGFNVVLDSNNGSGEKDIIKVTSFSYTLPECSFNAPESKEFAGWSYSADGDVIDSSDIQVTANVKLYAIWSDVPCDAWSYNAETDTFTINCTIPEMQEVGTLIPEEVELTGSANGIMYLGAVWGKTYDDIGFTYGAKKWHNPINVEYHMNYYGKENPEWPSFEMGEEYGYVIAIDYDANIIPNLANTTIILNGKVYNNVGVSMPAEPNESGETARAEIFIVCDFGILTDDGNFSGGDFDDTGFNVVLDSNNGSGEKDIIKVTSSSYTLPECGFTAPEGKEFAGWSYSADGDVIDSSDIQVTANVKLYAIWSYIPAPITYEVLFDANGGEGTMDTVTVIESAYTLPECGFTAPEGKEFAGWSYAADGELINGEKIQITTDITLYAVWSYIPAPITYEVLFDANGGEGTMDTVTVIESAYTLPECGFTAPEGKEFAGWSYAADGELISSEKIQITTDITLYAVWSDLPAPITYEILFDANGGEGTMATVTVTESAYTLPECGFTAPEGKEFAGWAYVANGEIINSTTISITADVTLYAIFSEGIYDIIGYSDEAGNTVIADVQNATKGTKITLTVVPVSEYLLSALNVTDVNGIAIPVSSDNTFVMPGTTVTISATFVKNLYTIIGYADENGNKVSADVEKAIKGTNVTLIVIPADGYTIKTLSVSDTEGNVIPVTDNRFAMPASDIVIKSVFNKNEPTPTPTPEPIIIIVPQTQPTEDSGNADASANEGTSGTEGDRDTENSAATGNESSESTENGENSDTESNVNSDVESSPETVTESGANGSESNEGVDAETIGVNPITEKKDAFVIDNLLYAGVKADVDTDSNVEANENIDENADTGAGEETVIGSDTENDTDAEKESTKTTDKEAVTAAIVEAIETAIAENNTKDFVLKADEQTVTEQGIENKAYADATTEEITEITKPSETKSVTLESAVMEALASAEGVESLTVMTSVADVEFDTKTIESINEQSDGSVQLVVTLLKEEIAQTAGENNKVYFDVSLIKEDGTKISTFNGGNLKVTVPIPKACQNEPVVVVYTDNKGHFSPVDGRVNTDGTYTFITAHLSEYVLMTKREAEEMYNSIYDFSTLKAHVEERTADSITIDWDQYEDADGYIIYGNYCNHDGETYKVKKLATITDSSQTEYTINGLEEGTNYKFRIKAYKLVNGEKYVTVKSHYVHAVTLGGKQRVTADIKIDQTGMKKTNTVTLKEGQTYTINAERLTDSGKAVHHVTMHYESSDASVATVSLRDGKITATGKGTCTVLAIAENGLYEEITVKVK